MPIGKFAMSEHVGRQPTPETFTIIERLFERVFRKVQELIDEANAIDDAIIASIGGAVIGPATAVDGQIVLFDGATGKLVKAATGTGVVHATAGVYSVGNVDLATEVSGNLGIPHFNSGSGATADTFWRGDGTWASAGGLHDLLSATHEDTIPGETPDIGALVMGKAFLAGVAEGFWLDGLPFSGAAGPNENGGAQYWADGLPASEMSSISDVRWGKLDPPDTFGNVLRGGPTGLFWENNATVIEYLDWLAAQASGASWQTFTFTDLTFSVTGGTGTWTVDVGDVSYFKYRKLRPGVVQIKGAFVSTTTTLAPTQLSVSFPATYLAFTGNDSFGFSVLTDDAFATQDVGQAIARATLSRLDFKKRTGAAFAAAADSIAVIFSITAEIGV
jgi:hypothetical protein